MNSIGILAKDPVWEEKLTAFSSDYHFRIEGSFWEEDPDKLPMYSVFEGSDLIWIPQYHESVMDIAIRLIKHSRHVLFGFPLSQFPHDACTLTGLANESRVKVQVGHHEHFNPAFRILFDSLRSPQFIELRHNIGLCGDEYREKLFHALLTDIDLCISLVPDSLKKFQSHASYIFDHHPPILNIRLEFNNGSVASLRIDPFTPDRSIKMAVIQKEKIYRADLLNGTASVEIFSGNGHTGPGEITSLWPLNNIGFFRFDENDPDLITGECLHFINCLNMELQPVSSLDKACEALKIARNIFGKVNIDSA